MKIRPLNKSDYPQWRDLWDQYLVFYNHTLEEAQTQLTFERLTSAKPEIHGLVIEVEAKLIGFTHSSFTHSTWSENQDLYLEDLFVDPAHRGLGAGRALIEAVAEFGKSRGAHKLYWQTHKNNELAQKLYASIASKSEFVIYEKRI